MKLIRAMYKCTISRSFYSFQGTKFLVTSGMTSKKGPTNNSEILDLTMKTSSGCQCNDWMANPYAEFGIAATGAFIGNSALICGGERPKECYSLQKDSADIVVQMNQSRVEAASIKLNETRYLKAQGNFVNKCKLALADCQKFFKQL